MSTIEIQEQRMARPRGYVSVIAVPVDGGDEIILFEDQQNLVVDQARENMAKLLANDENANNERHITKMSWGRGGHDIGDPTQSIPPLPSDTQLADEILSTGKKSVTYDFPDPTTVRFEGILTATDANGEGISEIGLWTDDDPNNPGNPLLFARKTFGLITKSSAFSFIFRWKILL